jgi:quercetin dioxygenase-like cupin family protein
MKKSFLTLAAMLAAGALHAETITPVQKQAIPEAAGKNVLMATVTYKPGEASEAHRHPGSIFAYVLEGHVTSQLEGSPAKTYGPGESWYEPPGAHHVVSKNASRTKPAKLLVFALAGDGEELKLPLQGK